MKLNTFWVSAFVFCCLIALMVQKLLLPMVPALHAGHGLLIGDAIIFHNEAIKIAERIAAYGWSEWKLYPPGFSCNVAMLSALYYIFGPEPATFIPFNVFAHVTGAIMIYLLGKLMCQGRSGQVGGLIAAILFLIYPSSLLWYSQNHKDSFTIAGSLIMLYAWMQILSGEKSLQGGIKFTILFSLGALLIILFRPYLMVLIGGGFVFSWLCSITYIICTSVNMFSNRTLINQSIFFICVLLFATIAVILPASETQLRKDKSYWENAFKNIQVEAEITKSNDKETKLLQKHVEALVNWKWNSSNNVLIRLIENPFHKISEIRVCFIAYGGYIGAGSCINIDKIPNNIYSSICFLPKSLIVGCFAPFPTFWIQRVSAPKLAASVETFIWYCFSIGFLGYFWKRPGVNVIAGITFCAFIITIMSYTSPNIGTLYRIRYGFWMFLLLCGSIGWISLTRLILNHIGIISTNNKPKDTIIKTSKQINYNNLATSGSISLAITFIVFIGFLARDLLLISVCGMSSSLDLFFSGMMIPMVVVTCLIMPISDAVTKPFLFLHNSQDPKESNILIKEFLTISIIFGILSSVVLFFFARPIIATMSGYTNSAEIGAGVNIVKMFTPIILFSSWTVLGNSVLNGLRKSSHAALAQLIVPVCAISFILYRKSDFALISAVQGMLVGTLLNAVVVFFLCSKNDIYLTPSFKRFPFRNKIFYSYIWLSSSAIFTALLVPVNYWFASKIGEGSVSAWAFASKIIILFNSLFAFGVTAIILPHLAESFDSNNNKTGRDELYLMLISGLWLGGFIALIISLFSDPIVFALLGSGSKITDHQIDTIAKVLRLGALQIPIAISGAITLKSVAVSGGAARTVAASFLGLAINFIMDWILVPIYGLQGIAYGSLGALVVTTILLCLSLRERYGTSIILVAVMIIGWILCGSSIFLIEMHNLFGVSLALILLLVMAFVHWISWKNQLYHRRSLRI